MPPYDPKSIANYFIERAAAEKKLLTPLQIIKLVYIAHGWHLGLRNAPLINEAPQAWKYGPVIPSLYHSLKAFGNEGVSGPVTAFRQADGDWIVDLREVTVPPPDDPAIRGFLKSVWTAYGHLSGLQLSALTHASNTPWQKAWHLKGAKYSKGFKIPEDDIREHYALLRERSDAGSSKSAAV